jgi:hypothetical protein
VAVTGDIGRSKEYVPLCSHILFAEFSKLRPSRNHCPQGLSAPAGKTAGSRRYLIMRSTAPSDLMSPAERLPKSLHPVAGLFACGRDSPPLLPPGESSLDCAGDQSGHANSKTEKG